MCHVSLFSEQVTKKKLRENYQTQYLLYIIFIYILPVHKIQSQQLLKKNTVVVISSSLNVCSIELFKTGIKIIVEKVSKSNNSTCY